MIEAAKLEADIYPAGPRGLSAYEIYKKEGGQLSEEEWLKSLNGLTPTIGENGNWFLGTVDTGLPSRGPKGDTGSIKFIVVTELPTENIDETAIYLKPVESPTGENKFEELIYVNGKWEDLGTPNVAVDLSNYYTKEETDNKIFESIPILYNSAPPNNASTNDFDLNSASNIINTLYKTGGKFFMYRNTKYLMPDILVSIRMGTNFEKTTRYTGFGVYNNISYKYDVSVRGFACEINGNWTNDLFTCTSIECRYSNKSIEPIIVSSYISDTVTDPVQGKVIKKYVDDTISASGGDKLHDYNIYTITLNDYNLKGTFPTITDTTTLAKFDEILTDIYKKRISANATYDNAFLIVYSSSDTFIFRTNTIQASYCYLYGTYIEEPIDSSGYTRSYQFYITGTLDTTAQTFKTTKVKFDRNSKRVLLANNTLSYTPTGDYNPATKKYVDDQVGNINTILATLTTVSEVTK